MVVWGNPSTEFMEQNDIASDFLAAEMMDAKWWSGTFRHPVNPEKSLFLFCLLRKPLERLFEPTMVNHLKKELQF